MQIKRAKVDRPSQNAELSQDIEVTVAVAAVGASILVYLGYRRWCACRPGTKPCTCHICHTMPTQL
jgi:hypothetical protein